MPTELPINASRLTIITLIVMTAIFVLLLPFAKEPLLRITPFIGAYNTTLVFNSLLTSLYFYCLYYRLNSRASLVLACGYLYEAMMIIPHGLAFPGLFTTTGLLGGSQTTAWIYMLWHGGFPLFAIAYAYIKDEDPGHGEALAIVLSVLSTIASVVFIVLMLAIYIDVIPPLLTPTAAYTLNIHIVVGTVWCFGLLALLVLWRKRNRSMVDLWLTIVMVGWVYDVALAAVWNHGRYDLGFYAGRVYGLIADGFVLVMLINETSRLNERLVTFGKRLFDANTTLEERVRERTEELAETERQLAQAQKMEAIGNLTGGIAHDFNNLLNVIIGNLDVLVETSQNSENDELLNDVLNAALRGRDMTKRLLAFARRQPLRPQRTDVNALLSDLFRLLERTLGSRIAVRLVLAEGLWPVEIDPGQLEDAITNLTANARDAMPNGGRITVTTSNQVVTGLIDLPDGPYVEIEVVDTGSGIPPKVIEHIFEPFYTTKGTGKGTGLGLSMVFGFMKQSGGAVTVSSVPGETRFRLYLPRALSI
jgi:signal transduction histidine kinase